MFPSKELIEWCVKHREFVNGLWKEKGIEQHDYFYNLRVEHTSIVHGLVIGEIPDWSWLPRQDQLVEMLEERGFYPRLVKWIKTPPWWKVSAQKGDEYYASDSPCPEIALLECLLAAMEKSDE